MLRIRLVIRTQVSSSGSLAVWMHHLRSLEVVKWEDNFYSGKALKMEAGVLVHEAVSFAITHNLLVVTGNGPTVGIAGGYTLGGGHSSLSSRYGLSTDRALEYEVIDGNGQYFISNREENRDLYWALSRGGGSSYGVVVSTTVKAGSEVPIKLGTLKFSSEGIEEVDFIGTIEAFHATLSALVDTGCQPLYSFYRGGFDLSALSAPGLTLAQIDGLLGPFLTHLKSLNIIFEKRNIPFLTYGGFFNAKGGANAVYGGSWFIPRSLAIGTRSRELDEVSFKIQDQGAIQLFMAFNLSEFGKTLRTQSMKGGGEC
ncbi:FAD-linked oxidoreductase ZEB1 [Colletotrichum spaethianum]|uniref:FAD-linked oxidoreductase ZEB1 n=1 Tax=Colletotrichum spaethianum TaxID=700344 RepID=A0AA37NY10_9PEZI|nr:FAD-linked oxidoreductase ZEB1 [Colletotrichum spaethianum]GKT42935.1 FAD-linked oxidoreductase ZEB1 [Colletotrichum spaethianum]